MRRIVSRGRDQNGQALPIVLGVVLIVVLISVAVLTRVDGDFNNANLETKIQQARALAQSGVADALFQIDQQGSSPLSFCNEPNSSTFTVPGVTTTLGSPSASVTSGGFPGVYRGQTVSGVGVATGTSVGAVSGNALTLSQNATASGTVTMTFSLCLTGVPGAPGTIYTARYSAATGAYTVLSQGTVRNASYAVKATVTQTPILVNAVYGGAFITFDGKSNASVAVTDQYGNWVPNATTGIAVGPGGTLTCNGPGVSPPDGQVVTYVNYGGSISKCTPYQNLGPIYDPQQPWQSCQAPPNPYGQPPTPCMPSTAAPCTSMSPAVSGSDAAGYTVTGPATLEPGVYVCRGGFTMTGTVKIDYAQNPQQNKGQVQIYVFPPVGSMTNPNISFTGSTVNACEPPLVTTGSANSGSCTGGLVGDPTDLQIYASGSGTASLGASSVNAVLWAPGMNLTLNGSADSLNWTGGLILGGITANGHPSFNLYFDQRLESEYQESSWKISNYVQTSPGFSIP